MKPFETLVLEIFVVAKSIYFIILVRGWQIRAIVDHQLRNRYIQICVTRRANLYIRFVRNLIFVCYICGYGGRKVTSVTFELGSESATEKNILFAGPSPRCQDRDVKTATGGSLGEHGVGTEVAKALKLITQPSRAALHLSKQGGGRRDRVGGEREEVHHGSNRLVSGDAKQSSTSPASCTATSPMSSFFFSGKGTRPRRVYGEVNRMQVSRDSCAITVIAGL